ncbi:uncharacterized protein [Argopecten irradians]|uniref:uncharacterized protein n=1 Tax=Argopecten irradians TaxID=31199 RepID=UPI00371ABC6F
MYLKVLLVFALQLIVATFGNIVTRSPGIDVLLNVSLNSWTEASRKCQLAAGTQNSDVSLSTLIFNLTNAELPTVEAWIGATATYSVWLELQSCNYGKELNVLYRFDISQSSDPAETCLQNCGNVTFYLTTEWCYCAESVAYSPQYCVATSCPGDRFCGNESQLFNSFTYYCMCKYAPVTVVDDGLIGGCKKVVHEGENTNIETADCGQGNPVLCKHLETGNRYIPGGISESWVTSALLCNAENATISGLDSAELSFEGDYQYWIGVFRIAHVKWETSRSDASSYCISVTVDVNGMAAKNVRDCSTILPSLCEITPVTQSVSQGQTTPVGMSSASTQQPTMGSTMSGQNTTMAAASSTDRTGLIVGIVLAIVFFLVLLVLAQFFITKRKRKQKEMEERMRIGSLKMLPHSLRKAGEENKLSFMDAGNDPHLYNELHELPRSKSTRVDLYDHVETGRASINLYSELHKSDQKDPKVTTYDTIASINAEREAGMEREMASVPAQDNSTYDSLGKV